MADLVDVGGRLELEGLREFVSGMRKAGRATKKTAKQISRFERFQNIAGKSVRTAGRGLSRAGGLLRSTAKSVGLLAGATTAFGAVSIRAFGQFDENMARIGTLLPPASNAMDEFGQSVLDASVQFGQSAENTADAFFQGISASVPADKIEEFTQVVGKAAVGASTDMATVTDGLTNVINAFGLEVGEAINISDAFFVANKRGKTTVDEIARSIGTVAPLASSLGLSYKDLLGTTVSLTKAGLTTSEAMTQMKSTLSNILKPSSRARKEAKKLGIEFGPAALKAKGFTKFMEDLTGAIAGPKGTDQSIGKLFKSVEAIGLVSRLSSKGGMADLKGTLAEIAEGASVTETNFAKTSNTIGFKLKQIKAGLGGVFIEIGRGLIDGLGLGSVKDIPAAMAAAAKTAGAAAKAFAVAFSAAFSPLKTAGEFDFIGLASSFGKAAGTLTTLFIKALELLTSSGLLDKVTSAVDFLVKQFAPEITIASEAGISVDLVGAIQDSLDLGNLSESEQAMISGQTGGAIDTTGIIEARVAAAGQRASLIDSIITPETKWFPGSTTSNGVAVTTPPGSKQADVVNVQNNLTVTVPGQGTFVKRDDASLRGAGDATKKSAQQLTQQLTGGGAVEFGDEVSVARETRGN